MDMTPYYRFLLFLRKIPLVLRYGIGTAISAIADLMFITVFAIGVLFAGVSAAAMREASPSGKSGG